MESGLNLVILTGIAVVIVFAIYKLVKQYNEPAKVIQRQQERNIFEESEYLKSQRIDLMTQHQYAERIGNFDAASRIWRDVMDIDQRINEIRYEYELLKRGKLPAKKAEENSQEEKKE